MIVLIKSHQKISMVHSWTKILIVLIVVIKKGQGHLLPGEVEFLLELCLWRHPSSTLHLVSSGQLLVNFWSLINVWSTPIKPPPGVLWSTCPWKKDLINFTFPPHVMFWEYLLCQIDQKLYLTKHYPVRNCWLIFHVIWIGCKWRVNSCVSKPDEAELFKDRKVQPLQYFNERESESTRLESESGRVVQFNNLYVAGFFTDLTKRS